ncbi:MAG: D-2-hydroxyacid dehydrogenase [Erysipelotrichales bacterium]|nr:MAG: D-2-hydroxyacid dehydrogenase [Erysipelotrichales bacterium]
MNLFFAESRPYPAGFEDALKKLGHTVYVYKEDTPFSQPEIIDLMIGTRYFVKFDCTPFTNLRFLQLNSAGYDRVPIERLKAMGVVIANARGVYGEPIAEWVVMQWLVAMKLTHAVYQNQLRKEWKYFAAKEARGEEVLIVGTGDIAREIAKRMRPFNVRITGVNTDGRKIEGFNTTFAISELHNKIGNYDTVILTLPLNETTAHLFDAKMIAAMKPGAGILNIGRGRIVDENALAEALNKGHLGYSAFDVFEIEPLPQDSPLWTAKNSIVSPHISYSGQFTKDRLAKLSLRNLEKFVQGKEVENRV